jgi:LmbE family N-acetylglucosaminyl deacetylase
MDVVIATVFSSGSESAQDREYYQARNNENLAAARLLETECVEFGFLDAPYRNSGYAPYLGLTGPVLADDRTTIDLVGDKILELCADIRPRTIFLPLAIGEHVDHRVVFQTWPRLDKDYHIEFYEDRPYVLLPGMINVRAQLLSAAMPSVKRAERYGLSAVVENFDTLFMYKNSLRDPVERFRWLLHLARRLHLLRSANTLINLGSSLTALDNEDLPLLREAVAAYKTQIPGLYGTMSDFDRTSAHYSQILREMDGNGADDFDNNSYIERYWKIMD